MAVATSFITIADVIDGQAGIQATFTDENHTFPAGADGEVAAMEFAQFFTDIDAFFGTTPLTYTAGNTPAVATQWAISNGSASGSAAISVMPSDANIAVSVSAQGRITIAAGSGTTGFGRAGEINQAFLMVPIRIQVDTGVFRTLNRIISLSKAVGGSAEFVRVSASTQTVQYAFNANTPRPGTENLVFNAVAPNIVAGEFQWSYFAGNPSTTSTFTPLDGTEPGVTVSGTNNPTLTITAAGFNTLLGSNTQVVFRAERGMALDQVSVVRITDASPGADAVSVLIVPNGSTQFKNNQGTVTLTAQLFFGGILQTNTGDFSYQWRRSNVNIPNATNQTLTVTAADIPNDGALLYSVDVTYPDP